MTLTLQSGGSLQSTQPTPFSKHKDLVGFNEQSFRRSVEDLNDTHERNINAYENVIRGMQEVVNSLMSKNQFLVQDQMALLMENERLRRENQELKDVFQLKQCLHSGSTPAQLPLFEVAYEQRAEGEAASQASNLYSQTSVRNPPVCVGNILENSVKSLISPLAMSRSANMIGFGNMGDSFPRLLTQNSASQNQFFMNNLKLSSQGNQLQTPGLPN